MFEAFLKIIPVPVKLLTAELKGVNGHTGRGRIRYAKFSNGRGLLRIRLRGVAGKFAEFIPGDGDPIPVDLKNGAAVRNLTIAIDESAPHIIDEADVEIRQNGEAILQGSLSGL